MPPPTASTLHHHLAVNEDEISSTNHSQDVRFVDQGCQTEKSGINNGHLGHQDLAADGCSTSMTTAAPNSNAKGTHRPNTT